MKRFIEWIKKILTKELLLYVAFGVGTTFVNIAAFHLFNDIFGVNYLIANIIAWVMAVTFAYITNKLFVFESRGRRGKELALEIAGFYGARLASLGVDELGMFLLVDAGGVKELAAKIIMNVVVIIINYVLSKFLIFKRKSE